MHPVAGRLPRAHGAARRGDEPLSPGRALVNDVGLVSEEYDPTERRLLGNFPQAFTHVGIVNSARGLAAAQARDR